MLDAQVSHPRYVGVAPGTTTVRIDGASGATLGAAPPPHWAPPVRPTQAHWVRDPSIDNVKIAVPPNQWVTGPAIMKARMPAVQATFGPVPNDKQLSKMYGYLPVQRGWMQTTEGGVYTMQGALGQTPQDVEDTAIKWSIAASVISALALATTTAIALLRYRKEK